MLADEEKADTDIHISTGALYLHKLPGSGLGFKEGPIFPTTLSIAT